MSISDVDGPADSALLALAEEHGIQPHYADQNGRPCTVEPPVLARILSALGVRVDVADPDDVRAALDRVRTARAAAVLPPTLTVWQGGEGSVPVTVPRGARLEVRLEREDDQAETELEVVEPEADAARPADAEADGAPAPGHERRRVVLPADLPIGVHRLTAEVDGVPTTATLLLAPRRLDTADRFLARRGWGAAAQLYSVTSSGSWGIGDLHDAGTVAEAVAGFGADFLLLNPLHASDPAGTPLDSPYSPVSRRFLNVLAVRASDIPEFAELPEQERRTLIEAGDAVQAGVDAGGPIDRPAAAAALDAALRAVHAVPRSAERQRAYQEFTARNAPELDAFAQWCAMRCGRDTAAEADFHRWCQWIADAQLAAAQSRAEAAGMRLGLMLDLAVGADRHTADHHLLGDQLVTDMSVGAPPDMYNQLGQDWSQHPWHPERLAEHGYAGLRSMLAAVMRHAGGVRIDHILGLFRLWWVPVGLGPTNGAYVRYDHEAMLATLLIEAHRTGTVVIGEDLGTFEPWVQERLAEAGVLGTDILWFDADEHGPHAPAGTRRLALAAVNTHDLPPTAGYLEGRHLDLRERLGLVTSDPAAERADHARSVASFLEAAGTDARQDVPAQVRALHRFMARRPAALHQVALVDAVGERRIQNQPGTTQDQYPNWTVPLADGDGRVVHADELASRPDARALFEDVGRALAESVPVALVVSYHTDPLAQPGVGDAGGMNTYVLASARALASRGVRPVLLTRAVEGGPRVRTVSGGGEDGPAVVVVELPAGGPGPLDKETLAAHAHDFAAAAVDWLAAAAEDDALPGGPIDPRLVQHVHGHYWMSAPAARRLAVAAGVPWVQTMHTVGLSKLAHDPDSREPQERLSVEALTAGAADLLVANAPDEATALVELLGADPGRVLTAAPGVDARVFTPSGPAVWPGGQGRDRDVLKVLFAGRIQRHKGPHRLVEALGILRQESPETARGLRLHVNGAASGAEDLDLPALARSLGVEDLVTFSAPVPAEELAAQFRGADLVAMPSASETFGLVALEAQACGTPVLAHDVGGLRASVRDGRSGRLISPNTAVVWARALAEAAQNRARWSGMSAAALEHARGHGWEAHVDALLSRVSAMAGRR